MHEMKSKVNEQKIYGIGESTSNRRSNTNHGSRSRNNGKFLHLLFHSDHQLPFLLNIIL
jgi:hypothetical protein